MKLIVAQLALAAAIALAPNFAQASSPF